MRLTIVAYVSIALLDLLLHGIAGQRSKDAPQLQWKQVQYLGGAVGVREKSVTWDNTLVVAPTTIKLLKGGKLLFEIETARVTSLYYAGRRHNALTEVGKGVSRGAVIGVGVVALIALFKGNETEHLIAIEYELPNGTGSGVLLRAHKNNYQEIVDALRAITGADSE